MSPRPSLPGNRPVLIAHCLIAIAVLMAVAFAATAHAGQFKMVACAGDSGAPPYTTATNTVTAQHPGGIFDVNNWCGGAGGDPPGDAAFMRISEHEPNGNAGYGAYEQVIFETPWYVHFKSAGAYTREPNAFNAGWLARFRVLGFDNQMTTLLNQGSGLPNSGLDFAASGIFGPHLWPFDSYGDYHHFYYELVCNIPGGCDRSNYNAVDANGFVFILSDDSPSEVTFTHTDSPLIQGQWVRGPQQVFYDSGDKGSGLRFERVRIDGADRNVIDFQALGLCNATSSQTNGEFARSYQPCWVGGPFHREWDFDSAGLSDGAHNLSVCAQDYGQYMGLNGTGGETCEARTIHVDNNPPGPPAGLHVTSANPNRYLEHFGAQFSLPPDPGSPIAKVHYQVVNAAGEAVTPEGTLSATNPTEVPDIAGPQRAGNYRLKVWLEDSVGLTGPATTAQIPHDTTPPAAPQGLSVTAPDTPRSSEGFDLHWHNIVDAGAPIDAVHYQVLNGAGSVVIPTQTVAGDNVQTVAELEAPSAAGSYQLRLWLTDAEGNVGAPVTAPLGYECMRSPVSDGQQLSAALGGQRIQTVQQGQGSTLTGALIGKGGPVATAPVCVFSRVVTDRGLEFLGIALTDSAGNYRFPIPAGPSRELSAVYRPDQRQLRASAELHTVVHPTLRTPSAVVRNKSAAHFEGEIPGPHNDDVTIVLQVKSGKGWLAFRRYRTRSDGHYELEYPFRRTTRPTTYEMRAQVRETTGYPYEQGDSDPLLLRVVPGQAKTRPAHSTPSRRSCEGRARHRSHTVKARCAKRHSKARGAR